MHRHFVGYEPEIAEVIYRAAYVLRSSKVDRLAGSIITQYAIACRHWQRRDVFHDVVVVVLERVVTAHVSNDRMMNVDITYVTQLKPPHAKCNLARRSSSSISLRPRDTPVLGSV